MRIITEEEAIRFIRQSLDTFVPYVGAGASSEAGVKTAWQICREIRVKLVPDDLSKAEQERRLRKLRWHDDSSRYAACIRAYGNQAARVGYFRGLLDGVKPAFAHHAIAMLTDSGIFKKTVLTTNFDKLIESAFTRQGILECQPIRSAREIEYWVAEPDKAYVLKLHGDYDTYNIANTLEQIVELDPQVQQRTIGLLESAGLLVLGAAGNEKSIYKLLDTLTGLTGPPRRVLDFGLLWAVYMGNQKPMRYRESTVRERINETVGDEIRNLMDRMENRNEQFAFFPIWGTGNFLLRLIDSTGSRSLMSRARRYLDHDMRLQDVFTAAGLEPKAIRRHLAKLSNQRKRIDQLSKSGTTPKTIFSAKGQNTTNRKISLRLVFGDITTRRMLDADSVRHLRRAVVSPEDTAISAGGGVAYQLLRKAGPDIILNELAKLQPIEHGSAAVTSGGNLPVEYLFHGAALKIESGGKYTIDQSAVQNTVESALDQAQALGVQAIWLPLFGSGVAGFSPSQSLSGILKAIKPWRAKETLLIHITIYSDEVMARTTAINAIKRALRGSFSFTTI